MSPAITRMWKLAPKKATPRRRVPHPFYAQFDRGRHTRESARAALGLTGDVALFFGYVRHYKGLDTLLQALAAHFGDLERIVAPQQFELPRFTFVVELRGELEERALPRVRHELLAERVIAVIDLNRHHQVARVLQRVRVFPEQFLGVQ